MFLRRALTRTSVGNKKYEYEYENGNLARVHDEGNQLMLALFDRVAGGVAVRHGSTLSEGLRVCQLFFEIFGGGWLIGNLDGWMAGWRFSPPVQEEGWVGMVARP